MIIYSKIDFLVVLLLSLVHSSFNAVLREVKSTNKSAYEQGLYSPEDDVETLTVKNFNTSVYGSKRAWMIEFYSNWCGYCQRSAPIYKAFASDVKNWNDLVGIGALDCANEENAPICTYYEVTKYPTFRYFHENFVEDSPNSAIKIVADSHTNLSEHRANLVALMVKEQQQGRGKMYPNLQPFNHTDVSKIFETAVGNPSYAFLIVQEPSDDVGPSITMDFHKVKESVVRYSFVNDTQFKKDLFPALYVLEKGSPSQFLSIPSASRHGFQIKIRQYLSAKNVPVPEFHVDEIYRNSSSKPHPTNMTHNELLLREKIKEMGDVVFQVDLENALRYSLKREVGGAKEITGEKLKALKIYMDVLVKYFPFGEKGKELLANIKNFVDSNDVVEGMKIGKLVKDAERPGQQVFASLPQWLACRGSSKSFRGYPCGLWKMFHYLTVNAANCGKDSDPKMVLNAMHGYIKYLFGCEDCSDHFLDMAERRGLDKVASLNESVLWLWRAHNEVNNRLSGDVTEDPEYPKVQFPSKDRCSQCYKEDGSWNEDEVLIYLTHMYSRENIKYMGSDPNVLHLGTMPAESAPSSSQNLKAFSTSVHLTSAGILLSLVLRGY